MFSIDVFPEMFEKRKKPQNNDLVNLRWLNYCIDLNILHSRTKILNTHAKFQVYLLPVPPSLARYPLLTAGIGESVTKYRKMLDSAENRNERISMLKKWARE